MARSIFDRVERAASIMLLVAVVITLLYAPALQADVPPPPCCGSMGCGIVYDWPCGELNGCASPNACCFTKVCPGP